MKKYDYLGTLEAMADAVEAGTACLGGDPGQACVRDCLSRALEVDRWVCETENALAEAFLPPVDRGDVAGLAHALRRAVWQVYDTVYFLSCLREREGVPATSPTALPLTQAKAVRAVLGMLRRPEQACFRPESQQFYRTCYLARHHRTDRAGDRALAKLCDVLCDCYTAAVEAVLRSL